MCLGRVVEGGGLFRGRVGILAVRGVCFSPFTPGYLKELRRGRHGDRFDVKGSSETNGLVWVEGEGGKLEGRYIGSKVEAERY